MAGIALFHGLNEQQVAEALRRLAVQRFGPGEVLLREGDKPFGLYVIQSGSVDILVRGEDGREHLVDREGPGATLGEMSLVTGQPVSATVRASSDVVALFMSDEEFGRVAAMHPVVFRNLGALLATRLQDANRRALKSRVRPVRWLVDLGAPPLLGYALACSLAWHTRATTALVVVGESEIPELQQWGEEVVDEGDHLSEYHRTHGARLVLAKPQGAFSGDRVAVTLGRLALTYEHLLVQTREGYIPPGLDVRRVGLIGTGATASTELIKDGDLVVSGWTAKESPGRLQRNGAIEVPELRNSDTEELQGGLLSTSSPAGKALGAAARSIAGLRVGLALGAGSEKGYAHIGVLKALERAGVPIDCIAGTSVGSGIGAYYAAGNSVDAVADMTDIVGASLLKLGLPGSSLLSSSGLRSSLRAAFGHMTFEGLKIPMRVVAADAGTGQEIWFDEGLLWPALLASMSIPGMFPAQRIGEHVLVDGGIIDPVPASVVRSMGADVVIAVRLLQSLGSDPVAARAEEPSGRKPNLLRVLASSVEIMQSKLSRDAAALADVLIEPEFKERGTARLLRFAQGKPFIEVGEAAAAEALERMAAALPWLR